MTGATMVPEPVFDVDRCGRADRARAHLRAARAAHHLPVHPRPSRPNDVRPGHAATGGDRRRRGARRAGPGLWSELGIETVLTAYGLTEAAAPSPCADVVTRPRSSPGHRGGPSPTSRCASSSPAGTEVARGEAGEVVVRGYNVMRGYFNDTEASEEAVDRDGWLHTGDIGVMDEAGNVAITDRLKDMYVSGGFNVYPAEVEAVLPRPSRRWPGGGDRGARSADGRGGSGPRGPGHRARVGPGRRRTNSSAGPGSAWPTTRSPGRCGRSTRCR